jgi:pyridoxal phosphate enzyme (YggS family)
VSVAERLSVVRARIEAAGGDPERVRVVAVTKTFGPEAVAAAIGAGLTDVGENRADELIAKHRPDVTWHFVGRIQRNKLARLVPLVDLWQSVDREQVVDDIGSRRPGAAILIQVNVTEELQKGGSAPSKVGDLVARARDRGLDVRGLMTIGPLGPPEAARPGFRTLVRIADELGLPERSMGMTGDLEVAVEEGATMVRIGTALFGAREQAGPRTLPGDLRR